MVKKISTSTGVNIATKFNELKDILFKTKQNKKKKQDTKWDKLKVKIMKLEHSSK